VQKNEKIREKQRGIYLEYCFDFAKTITLLLK